MSRAYKTARGKTIDIDKIKLANETTLAVGNMKVNARGDKIGVGGIVESSRNKIMDRVYSVPTGEIEGGYSPTAPDQVAMRTNMMESNRAKELHDLTDSLVKTNTDTQLPTTESVPKSRRGGSLASAVAKTATVKQEPMADPRTPKGPSRL